MAKYQNTECPPPPNNALDSRPKKVQNNEADRLFMLLLQDLQRGIDQFSYLSLKLKIELFPILIWQ